MKLTDMDKQQRYHKLATIVEGCASLGQNDSETAEILNEIITAAKVELAKVTDGNSPAEPNSEQPKTRTITNKLTDIHDELRQIQCMTKFLGAATTNLSVEYEEDMRWGGELCFIQIDRRIVETIDNIGKITTEVRQHENDSQAH